MCIVIICLTGFDVTIFENDLCFRIKLFFYTIKKSRQKFKNLENKKRFEGETKKNFIIFKAFQLPKILLELRVGAFNHQMNTLNNKFKQ